MTTIEIKGTGFINKGAELMHHAILQKISEHFHNATIVMAPDTQTAPYYNRARLGHYQKFWFCFRGIQLGYCGPLIPKKLRNLYGIILDKEIDVVLDAAGFAYSDQFGIDNSVKLAKACKKWKKKGTKLLLLPQALGPFTSHKIKESMKIITDHAEIIYARDKISYDHITSVVGKQPHIQMAADFTNLVDGIIPETFNPQNESICIIPNDRMLKKTSHQESDSYLAFLTTCIDYLQKNGKHSFFLIHEGTDDHNIAESINKMLSKAIPVLIESDPIKIKGIIGSCHATIGSRYHGLVSALSQGIPSLATGWSHKYAMLFDDYQFPEGLLNATASRIEIIEKIDFILNKKTYNEIKTKLNTHAKRLKIQSSDMWENVVDILLKTSKQI